MKKVIEKEELTRKMEEAVNILCNTVKKTLGPTGNNVLINTSDTSPFITNDGVTIAKSIESEDKIINTILEIAKEASLKTNETVGDGTTTTLVLMQSIFNMGLKEIKEGINPIKLKKEINDTIPELVDFLLQKSRVPSNKELSYVAGISANDKLIGELVSEVYNKVKYSHSIKLQECKREDTYYEIKKGYTIEIGNIPDIYFENNKEYIFNHALVLISEQLDDLEAYATIINEVIEKQETLIILSSNYSEEVLQNIILLNLQIKANIFLVPLPEYGSRTNAIIKDLMAITKVKKFNSMNILTWEDLGHCEHITLNKETITFINNNLEIKRIEEIKEELKGCEQDYEQEFLEERLSMLENGIAIIYVGGLTKTEKRERLMRFEDCIQAIETAKKGVLPGEGISLLELSDKLEDNNIGKKIIKKSLQKPFLQIMANAGIDRNLLNEIEKAKYKLIYNLNTLEFERTNESNIIDPALVLIESIKNAISIASMLLTAESLVINEIIEKEQIFL